MITILVHADTAFDIDKVVKGNIDEKLKNPPAFSVKFGKRGYTIGYADKASQKYFNELPTELVVKLPVPLTVDRFVM
jgi:hypothetical protein